MTVVQNIDATTLSQMLLFLLCVKMFTTVLKKCVITISDNEIMT